jgi:hypothetical protein
MSRKSPLLATIVLAVPALSQPAWSSGGDGRRIVRATADQVLASHPTAKAKASALLNGRSLSEAVVFADCAKGLTHRALSDEERNPDHHAYYYSATQARRWFTSPDQPASQAQVRLLSNLAT